MFVAELGKGGVEVLQAFQALVVSHRAVASGKALQAFARFHVNMSKIESRPSRQRDWEYVFYVDLAGHCQDPEVAEALEELEQHCSLVKMLGSYPDGTE